LINPIISNELICLFQIITFEPETLQSRSRAQKTQTVATCCRDRCILSTHSIHCTCSAMPTKQP